MIIVLAIDALEYKLVERFNAQHLKQEYYGKTDISEFSQPRTMVLWSSFATGQNKEAEVLADGNREMWDKRWPVSETFFSSFKSPVVIDLPGFSYELEAHERSRKLLKSFFDKGANKEQVRREYNNDAFAHHRKIKGRFLKAMDESHDFVLGYFSVVDVIGHLNFGNTMLMRMLYREMDDLAKLCRGKADRLLVLSDHGMKPIGMFGDHSEYGFWSTNWTDLGLPKITGLGRVLTENL